MEKRFNVAGVSNLEGQAKYRFASGSAASRAKVLSKNGHTNIDLRELPSAMTKQQAIEHLNKLGITAESTAAPAKQTKAKTKTTATVNNKPKLRERSMEEVAKIRADRLVLMKQINAKLQAQKGQTA